MTHGSIFSSGTAGTLVALVHLLGTSVFVGVLSESFWRTQFKMNENFFAFLALTFALPVALPLPPFFQQCPIPHQCIQHLNRPYPRALPHTPCAGGWGGGGCSQGVSNLIPKTQRNCDRRGATIPSKRRLRLHTDHQPTQARAIPTTSCKWYNAHEIKLRLAAPHGQLAFLGVP